MDLDDVLHQIGDWDRYQHLLLWLVCLPACIPCGFNAFNQVFMDRTPDHWCRVPQLMDNFNLTLQQRKSLSIPQQGSQYSQCEFYDSDYDKEVIWEDGEPKILNRSEPVPCRYGWEYDTEQVASSIVIDFDLVCAKSLYPTLALSSLNLGGLVGVLLFGYLNDRIGRKRNYFLCLTVEIVGGVATGLAPDIVSWSISRFVVGLTIPAILHIPFVIGLEVVAPSKRTLVSFYSNMFYVFGLVLFSGVAYSVRLVPWTWLAYASTLPLMTYFIYIIFLPESMRWLLSQGEIDRVIQMLTKVAKVNQKPLSEDLVRKFKETAELKRIMTEQSRQGKKANLAGLFRTPNMRMKTMIISFSWVVNETVYVGLSYYGPAIGSDAHLSFFLSTLVEIPGYVLCLLLMDRWGRRLLLCVCMIISGISAVSTALVDQEAETATLILFLISKMTIAGGTLIIFQFGGELYPTEVRGVGIGLASFLGGIALTIIPFINYLGSQWLTLPILIMGVFSIVGGLVTLRLPETLNQKLPQTLEEGENFGQDVQWLSTLIRCKLPMKAAHSSRE